MTTTEGDMRDGEEMGEEGKGRGTRSSPVEWLHFRQAGISPWLVRVAFGVDFVEVPVKRLLRRKDEPM